MDRLFISCSTSYQVICSRPVFSVVPVEAQTFATGQKLEDALLTPPADFVAMVCHGHLGPKHSGKEHLKTSCQALAQFQLFGLPMEQFLQHLNVITISQGFSFYNKLEKWCLTLLLKTVIFKVFEPESDAAEVISPPASDKYNPEKNVGSFFPVVLLKHNEAILPLQESLQETSPQALHHWIYPAWTLSQHRRQKAHASPFWQQLRC